MKRSAIKIPDSRKVNTKPATDKRNYERESVLAALASLH